MLFIFQMLMHGKRIIDIVYQIINHKLNLFLSEISESFHQHPIQNCKNQFCSKENRYVCHNLLFPTFAHFHSSAFINGCPLEGGSQHSWSLASGWPVLLGRTWIWGAALSSSAKYPDISVIVEGIFLNLPEFKFHAWRIIRWTNPRPVSRVFCAYF